MNKNKFLKPLFISFLFLSSLSAIAVGVKVSYSYDEDNRLIQASYSDGRIVNFTYDKNGNITAINSSGAASPGPIITKQPSYYPREIGQTLTLSVLASGSGLTYQWYKDGIPLTDSARIGGSTTNTLTIIDLQESDKGRYYCLITDGDLNSATSSNVHVSVLSVGETQLWKSAMKLAPGIRFNVYNFEVPGLNGSFSNKPRLLLGELVSPLKGRTVTYALSLVNLPKSTNPLETIQCIWITPVQLFDLKNLNNHYKLGYNCEYFLSNYPQQNKDAFVKIQSSASTAQYLNRFFTLVPPKILYIEDEDRTVTINSAKAGDIITITGEYFGDKIPTVYMEYKIAGKPEIQKLSLKVITPLAFNDAKNKANSSCMNPDTGESRIQVQIPAKLPAGIIKNSNNIVINNKQGLATFPFTLQ